VTGFPKITFLAPPTFGGQVPDRLFGCSFALYYLQPLSYLYPAAVAEEAGAEAVYRDCPVEGMDEEGFTRFLEGDDSDVYAFFTLLISKEMDLQAARRIREVRGEDPLLLFMGPQPTFEPEAFLRSPRDWVIRGETEAVMADLVQAMGGGFPLSKVPGLSWFDGAARHNPPRLVIEDLDALPFPARHLIHPGRYYNPKLRGHPSAVLLSSRGCPHRCYYCVPCAPNYARELEARRAWKKKPEVRLRSAENVVAELELLADEGYRSVAFMDDQFLWGKERTLTILKALESLGLEYGILARADRLTDPEIVRALRETGCAYIDIGIESLHQEILDSIGKDLRLEDFYRAVRLLKEEGPDIKLNILFGSSPLETRETIRETVERVKALGVEYVMFSLCSPFPGTDFHRLCEEEGYLDRDLGEMDALRRSLISYPHLSGGELEEAIREAYRSFYLRPGYLLRRALKMRSFRDLKNNLLAAKNLLS
jgi:radical SAM superfamily enzyme YgiQ (UPF0313 family)